MEKNYIYNVLTKRGYDEYSARLVAAELTMLHKPLDVYLEKWIQNESVIIDYDANGYSVKQLMEERGMAYPAALLSMDWLIKEPIKAMESLKRGIR
ncbi:hypothetical protein [Phocaeicola plebeius]|uniref:hypothetical protein n=1 Tax=Phocaeicola plebeius TaxID=310297 RepID=UPI0029435BC4|nr:hypothetical protein [Phocaeicola plebeius]